LPLRPIPIRLSVPAAERCEIHVLPDLRSKIRTRTYSQSGDKITLAMTTVGPDGKEVTTQTTYQLNGKDFPVTGTPDYDSLAARRIQPHDRVHLKKGGRPWHHQPDGGPKDGKTLTRK